MQKNFDEKQATPSKQTHSGRELMKKIIDMINEEGIFAHEEKPDLNQVFGLEMKFEKAKELELEKFHKFDEFSILWHPNDTKIKDQFEKQNSALPICFFDVETSFDLSYKKSDTEIVIFDKRDNSLKIFNTIIQEVDQMQRKRFSRSVIMKKSLKDILMSQKFDDREYQQDFQNQYFDKNETVTRVGPSKDLRDIIIGTTSGKLLILDVKDFRLKYQLNNPTKTPVTDFVQKQNFVAVAYQNGQINIFQRQLAFQHYSRCEIKQPEHTSIRALKLSPYTKHFIAIQELNSNEQEISIIKDPSKVEKVSNTLLLYDTKTLKLCGQTELISTKCRNYELKKLFDFCEKCVFIRSDCLRSFDVFSLDSCELLCQAPENIDLRQITLIQCLPEKQQVLLVGYYGDCYYYDSTGKQVDDDKHNNKYPYMITPSGFFDSKLVSLQDRLTLCKLGKQIYNQTVLFHKNEQVIYFADEDESFIIQLAKIKPDFDNVITAKMTLDQKIFLHTYSAQNTKFMNLTDMKSANVIKTFKNFSPITCSYDSQYFICQDTFNKQMFRINLQTLESELLEDIHTQMLCASKWDNFIFFTDQDEETNKFKLTIYDLFKKQKIAQLNHEFDHQFYFQISNHQMVIIISTLDNKFIKVNCKRPRDIFIEETITTEIGQSSHINFDSSDNYFLTGSSQSGDIYIYDVATMKLVQTIDIHIGTNSIGYFVEKDRLVTKNNDKMVYWKWAGKLELLFIVYEDLQFFQGYNRTLSGIIINQEISIWSEKLTHELTDNCLMIGPHSLKKEWVKGPLIKVYPLILNHFLATNQEEKIKLMPHIMKYVILPYGFSILSKFVYTNQKLMVKEACKIQNVRYIRDVFGNTPLLYALKRQDYECVDAILQFLSKNKKEINQISFSALLLLIKVAPQQLCPFFESTITEITQGMVELGCKIDDYNQTYYEYDLAQRLRPEEIHKKLLNLKAPETDCLPITFFQSQLNLNCEVGSTESILFAQALAKCPNEAIFRTKFVHNLLQHKWTKMKRFANLLLFLTIAFTATISVHSFTPGQTVYIHLLKLQNYFWAGIEVIIFWQSGYSFKYNGRINILLFFILNIYCWFTLESASPEIDSLLPLINWLAWFQMILQLQQFELIRTFVSIFLECIKSLAAFNYFLVLMIFTFATTQDIIQKNIIRHALIGKDRGPYSVEFYEKHNAIQDQTQNLVELWNSIYDTWIAIIKGDFVDNEGNLWRGFVYVSTFISTVVLLNLIIAFMSDSYANAIAKIQEKKNKTLNQMTLRLEKVMFWRKNQGKKSLLIWADYENNNSIQEEETEDLPAIVENITKSQLLLFLKKLDHFLYDISLLVIQSKQKINNQIDTIEDSLGEQLQKKLNIIKNQITQTNLMEQMKKKMQDKLLPFLKKDNDEQKAKEEQELQQKINEIYSEKQNESHQEQLNKLTKLVSDKILDYQKQLKGINKKFDETINSLVEEVNHLMADIYKDNDDVVSQTSYQRQVIKQQKQQQTISEHQQNINKGLEKIQDNLNSQLQNQQKHVFNLIEKKFSLLKKQISEDLLNQITTKQKTIFQEMVKSLELNIEGQLKYMKIQEKSVLQKQEMQLQSLAEQQLSIQQQIAFLIQLVSKK